MALQFKSGLIIVALIISGCMLSSFGQTSPQPSASDPQTQGTASSGDQPSVQLPGAITGTVVDQSGAVVAGARVMLTGEDRTASREVISGSDGQFSFSNVPPGPFQLRITSTGFATQTSSGLLHSGQLETVPQVVLDVATNVTEVQVGVPQVEVAAEQMKVQEQQRVLGAIPNFYVSYVPHAAPLNTKQKFELAWKTTIDPFTLVVVGGTAGVQQAQNHFREYGQGAQGYAKRFGAVYADTVTSTFIGGAIFPSLLKQDPRYFYKGTGSTPSRFLYAIANSVVCRGDNGRWQPNYSNIMGSMAAGGISNLYYPANDRGGAELTFENAGIGIGTTAVTNLLQEFLIRKLTPKSRNHDPAKP